MKGCQMLRVYSCTKASNSERELQGLVRFFFKIVSCHKNTKFVL